jgi:6-phosphogluconolactonase
VLRVEADGTLTAVPGSHVSSGGIEPVSIAVHGDLVYVANEGDGTSGSNYTGFTLNDDGRLTPLPDSTVALPGSALRGDILFNATGRNLVRIEVGTTDPSTRRRRVPSGSEFSPTNPHHQYVSNAHCGAGNGSVSAFSVTRNAKLNPIGASPSADGQTAPCWVEILSARARSGRVCGGPSGRPTHGPVSSGSIIRAWPAWPRGESAWP